MASEERQSFGGSGWGCVRLGSRRGNGPPGRRSVGVLRGPYYFGKKDGDRVINNSTDFAMYLLEVGHVATVGGDAFGSPECFRMSYATSDENIVEAMKRIKETVARLK